MALRCALVAIVALAATPALAEEPSDEVASAPARQLFVPDGPACVRDITDFIKHATAGSVGIVSSSSACNRIVGFRGRCSRYVIYTFEGFLWTLEDTYAMAFNCFNNRQPCGQVIADGMRSAAQSAVGFDRAASACDDVVKTEDPLSGFFCWRFTWRGIAKMTRFAKFIDLAVNLCGDYDEPDMPGGAVEPVDAVASDDTADTRSWGEPLPVSLPYPAQGDQGQPPKNSKKFELGAESSATWQSLQQPSPFQDATDATGDAVERRRLLSRRLRSA